MNIGAQKKMARTKRIRELEALQEKIDNKNWEWYSERLRSLLGHQWPMFYFLVGGRETGKSYAVTEFYVRRFKKNGNPFIWLRLTEASQKKLLNNNAEKLVDADLKRKYGLDLVTSNENVYNVTKRDEKGKVLEKTFMCKVLALSTFYSDKGQALFDKDFLANNPKWYYHICLDEMNREKSEKKSFDILYNFRNQIENLIRTTKERVRIICIGNTLDDTCDILTAFNFQPMTYGRYKLKKKRAIIDYIEETDKYKERRSGSAADILGGNMDSTFTNEVQRDMELILPANRRLRQPQKIIQFSKNVMFTVWDSNIITKYNRENLPIIAMRPYLDRFYQRINMEKVVQIFNERGFQFKTWVDYALFKKEIGLLKPSR